MSLIVNETRLPATVKRLFKNSVCEIIGELLQNAQRAGASEVHFNLDRETQTIIVRDDGSGISPNTENWARVLRMADSFYSDSRVEANQKPMGVGLLSLFALDAVKNVSISSRGKCALIETDLLWESEDYWATWTDLITDAPETICGFKLTVKYEESEATASYNRLAHKFEYALTKFGDSGGFAPPRGYRDFLKIFLDGKSVDTSLPAECVPAGDDLLFDGFYENNRLRIGQSASPFRHYAYVVWYGQIIRLDSQIPFLLEVSNGSPVTPLAPTRTSLVDDRKLANLRRFVEDTIFTALADETTARKIKPAFVERLYTAYPQRAKNELPVCVVREVYHPPDRSIESYADYCDLGTEKVLSYGEIETRKTEIFESGVSVFTSALRRMPNHFAFSQSLPPSARKAEPATEKTIVEVEPADEWTEFGEGAESFADVVGGAIRFLVVGNRAKLPLKKIYWKPGAALQSIFARAGEFAVVSVGSDPVESDFRSVAKSVFVFEYTGNFDIEEIEGLCVGVPVDEASDLLDAAEWLGTFGKACYSPDDDYDYDRQEEDFNDSISRLILDLRGDVLSTNWSFHELKMLVGKIVAGNGENTASQNVENQTRADDQIKGIEFLDGDKERGMIVKLANETEIPLKIASHTYLN